MPVKDSNVELQIDLIDPDAGPEIDEIIAVQMILAVAVFAS